jgi:hypothetical protein
VFEGQKSVATCVTLFPGWNVSGTVIVCGAGAVAVPVKVSDCCVPTTPPALSVNVTAAVRVPTASGVNVALMTQFKPAPKVLGEIGQLFVCVNSVGFAPVIPIFIIASAEPPEFVNVNDCTELLLLITVDGKVSLVGERVTAGGVVVVARIVNCAEFVLENEVPVEVLPEIVTR